MLFCPVQKLELSNGPYKQIGNILQLLPSCPVIYLSHIYFLHAFSVSVLLPLIYWFMISYLNTCCMIDYLLVLVYLFLSFSLD